jgi:mono/diheme cytochrome c family protein
MLNAKLMRFLREAALTAVVLVTAAVSHGQEPSADGPVTVGRQVYLAQCASCHGEAGTGYGPASWTLRTRPPDLTRFSDRTTPFPRAKVRNAITGHLRLEPSHGPSEMPRWRTSLDAAIPPTNVSEMDALLVHLEEMQRRRFGEDEGPSPQARADAGRHLFQSHCVPCHGEDGRGLRPTGYVVGLSADLTTIATRNGGRFPALWVYEAIAGCDSGAAQTGMPAWKLSFTRAGWGGYLAMKNIEALAAYVESIQR